MILTDGQILKEIENKSIVIEPFDRANLGVNSYDVHLGKRLAVYKEQELDAKKNNAIEVFDIPEEGFVLQPGELYLGVTQEYTETHNHVPFLEGKSSTGRLGISIHATAGKGDVGFKGSWTLEINSIKPTRVYAGMPIGQLIYFEVDKQSILVPYHQKKNAKYTAQTTDPVGSMMWKNSF
ncbi:hypothetical protein C9374_014434 [Naegleria lovaniensis]|uniref:dCTP deaminase n=1 Tax=Naegleria lovaniensis TaxID=51637 RepID=A0AA88KPF1_NAELO|nr:uncharacterized protein C9374_014434 [Naegleria lovaniensis]KAG2389034.1 hypothetical protein C9374_014434 [Naegleria lovaniensis]